MTQTNNNENTLSREYIWDYLKGIAIFLVVTGHFLEKALYAFEYENMAGYVVTNVLYTLIYSFHMPVFVFISGYLSKNYTQINSERSKKTVKTILIPFLIFNTLYWLVRSLDLSTLFDAQYVFWYLLCLFVWRMTLPGLSKIKGSILLSFAAALLIGFTPAGKLLSVSRAFAFLPYFLLGFYSDKKLIMKIRGLKKTPVIIICAVTLLSVAVLCLFGLPESKSFMMLYPYKEIETSVARAFLLRIFGFAVGYIMIICLVAVVPERNGIISKIGKNSMTVYIGHAFIALIVEFFFGSRVLGKISDLDLLSILLPVLSVGLAVPVCFVLGSNKVSKLYNVILEKISKSIMRG